MNTRHDDRDPEHHSFEVRETTERDHVSRRPDRDHILEIVSPTHGDTMHRSSSLFSFSLIELADLHDQLGGYLDEHRGKR